MALPQPEPVKPARQVFGGLLLAAAAAFFIWAFSSLPLDNPHVAFDLRTYFWPATHGFRIVYVERVYNPPWVLALLWPLTIWPLNVSRGFMALATLAAVALSVPRQAPRRLWLLAMLLLVFSHPVLRQLGDLNVEFFLIFGALLLAYALSRRSPLALAGATALLSAKVQESWLLAVVVAVYVLRTWPPRTWLRALAWLAAFTLPFLAWKGAEWLGAMQRILPTVTNSSLRSVFSDFSLPPLVFWLAALAILAVTLIRLRTPSREIDRFEMGALLAAGLLLSPYASNTSLLTPLAIGVAPYIQRRPLRGAFLMVLFYLPYFLFENLAIRFALENAYAAIVTLLIWGLLLWETRTGKPASISGAGRA